MKTDEISIISVSDAARILEVCVPTIRNWVRAGKLNAMRTPSGQRLFLREEIERLARERGAAR